jgi:TusA-related sulfurtransferase
LEKAAEYIVDFRGAIKSLTLLKLTHVFRGMKSDEVVRIVGLDPDTRNDLFKVLPALSYELVLEEERDGEFCSIHLKKRDSESHTYLYEKE